MTEPLTTRIFGRRRNLLINSPYQHRVSLITTLLALLPPAIFFGIYYLITSEGSRRIVEASPSLESLVRGQDRTESLLILAAVLFYGLGVYLVTLLESHRTAGFLHRVNMRLQELCDGRYGGVMRPRREDNFIFLADGLNGLSRRLQEHAERDVALLDEISQTLDATLAGLGPGNGRGRERLLALRGRIEALRRLKRSHFDVETPSMPTDVPQVSDAPPAERQEEAPADPLSS